MTVRIQELRERYRALMTDDTPPETWLAMAFSDLGAAAETCGLRQLADEPRSRRLVAEHCRLLIGKAAATTLEALTALERSEGFDGPISETTSQGEAEAIM